MSGLALVCARLGRRGQRQRPRRLVLYGAAARGRPRAGASATTPRTCPADAEVVVSTAIADGQPGAGAGPRARPAGRSTAASCWPSSAREKRLIAVAGTHGKTTTTAMVGLGAAGARRRPGLLRRRRGARARPDGERRQRRLGRGRVGRSPRPTRATPASSSCEPEVAVVTNVEMDHHSRWGSLAELHRRLRALRRRRREAWPSAGRGHALDAARRGRREAARASTPPRPGPAELAPRGARPPQPAQRPRRPRRARAGRRRPRRRGRRARATSPGCARRLELKGDARRRPHLRRLRPPPDRGARGARGAARARARAPGRRLPAPPLLADQGARRASSARRSRSPTRSASSTSTRRARSRSASWPGSAACRWPRPRPTAPAGGRSGGCPTPTQAAARPRPAARARARSWSRSAPATSSSSPSALVEESGDERRVRPRASSATTRWRG